MISTHCVCAKLGKIWNNKIKNNAKLKKNSPFPERRFQEANRTRDVTENKRGKHLATKEDGPAVQEEERYLDGGCVDPVFASSVSNVGPAGQKEEAKETSSGFHLNTLSDT